MVMPVDAWGSAEYAAYNFRDHKCFHKLCGIEDQNVKTSYINVFLFYQ